MITPRTAPAVSLELMTIAQILEDLRDLSPNERRRVIAYLVQHDADENKSGEPT